MKIIRAETVPWTSVMSIFYHESYRSTIAQTNKQTKKFELLA